MLRTIAVAGVMGLGMLTIPAALAAQGCPWCTTPTTCSTVNEDAAQMCWVTQQGGCDMAGTCEYSGPPEGSLLRELQVDERALIMVAVEDRDVVLVPVGGGVYAAWNCQGQATYAYELTSGGLERVHDRDQLVRYALGRVRARAARARYIAGLL